MTTPAKPDELLVRRRITDLNDLGRVIDKIAPSYTGRVGAMWDALAARYRCSARTVQRTAINNGLWEPTFKPHHVTPEQSALMWHLAGDGMPSNWIGETVGHNYQTVIDHLGPRRSEVMTDWLPVWQSILKNPTLHALHDEFAPPATHTQEVARMRPAA